MRYQFLDSMRGWAICGVLLIHTGQAVIGLPQLLESFARFGLRGVQLFFLVSALTLCLVTKPERFIFSEFYIRRFFRIAPMFYIAAIFYTSMSLLGVMELSEKKVSFLDIFSTLFFLHGLYPPAINNVVPGGWSIASEAIFYAMFPFLFFWVNSLKKSIALFAFSVLIACAANKLLNPLGEGFGESTWREYLHFNFLKNAPAFACGFVVFYAIKLFKERERSKTAGATLMALTFICIIAISCFSARVPASQIIIIPFLGMLVFLSAIFDFSLTVNRFFSFLGEVSFSIYLVHFAVLHVILLFFPMTEFPIFSLLALYAMTLFGSSLLAWGAYNFIERPMADLGRRLSKSKLRSHALN